VNWVVLNVEILNHGDPIDLIQCHEVIGPQHVSMSLERSIALRDSLRNTAALDPGPSHRDYPFPFSNCAWPKSDCDIGAADLNKIYVTVMIVESLQPD